MSFAGAMLGASGALVSQCKAGKYAHFKSVFSGDITTENETLQPYGKIDGHLTIDSERGTGHYGLCIQLEAEIKYKFVTKLDNMTSNHKLRTNIIEGAEPNEGNMGSHQISPVRTIIVAEEVEPNYIMIKAGTTTYSFSLKMPGDTLPAPFKSTYGSLSYRLVAYIKSQYETWVEFAEKVMRFRGYYNLSQNPDTLKPIEVERSLKKSLFSSKKAISVTLSLPERGYLADEELPFLVTCLNYRCQPLQLEVILLQRSTYNVNGAKKTTVATLGRTTTQVDEPTVEFVWESGFRIHKAASPSYCINPIYTVAHAIQFRVKVGRNQNVVLRGEAPVFIGTTRDSIETLMLSANSLKMIDDRFPSRRGSLTSECSGFSCVTLPPAYSQLSSRAPSLETLPPAYDDVPVIYEEHGESLESHAISDETSESNSQHGTTPATPPPDD